MLAIALFAAVGVSVLIGISAAIVRDLESTLDGQRRVLIPARRALAHFEHGVREQQRGERGYVITSDRTYLEPFENGLHEAEAASTDVRRLLAGEPAILAAFEEAATADARWLEDAVRPAIAAVDRGAPAEAGAIVAAVGRTRFEGFEAEMQEANHAVEAKTDRVEAELAVGEDRLLRLLMGAALSGVLILALVIASLEKWIIAPVDRLRETVRRVATGELDQPVAVVGPREVVELADDVDAMRLRILAEVDEMRRANEALGQQAPLVVGLRDVLLPAVTPPPSLLLEAMFVPAEGVLAGDWFDVWSLDDGRVGLVVADISGHGAEAGLFALRLKDLLVSAVAIFPQPGEALGWVADRLGDTGERFATIFLAVLDTDRGRMLYGNAGHPAVLLAQPESIVSLLPTGPLLGPLRSRWDTRNALLGPDTVLVAYTDGLVEARSSGGEEFGAARLLEVVTRARGGTPAQVVDACRAELESFGAGRSQDDITLVAVSIATPPG